MSAPTGDDRERATQIVERVVGYSRELFVVPGFGDEGELAWIEAIAQALAEERERALNSRGLCGHPGPTAGWTTVEPCDRHAGHDGPHRRGPVSWGF